MQKMREAARQCCLPGWRKARRRRELTGWSFCMALHILCLISAEALEFVLPSFIITLSTWLLVACNRLSMVDQRSLGLERSRTRTIENVLERLKRLQTKAPDGDCCEM